MFATFEAAIVIGLLKIAKLAICARSTFAQLSHVTFRSDASGVFMIATDLDMELALEIPQATMPQGSFNLSLPELQKFLASADRGGLVTVSAAPESVEVTSDGMTRHFETFAAEDMPSPVSVSLDPACLTMPEKDLHDVLSTCLHSASTEATRYYLQGVFVHASAGGNLAFVSTDGHRLSLFETKVKAPDNAPCNIIPSAAVRALLAALDPKSPAPCVVQWSKLHTVISGASFRITTKNIDGSFPDYTRVIPHTTDEVTFNKADVVKSAGRIVKLSSVKCPRVALDFEQGKIRSGDGKTHAPFMFLGNTSLPSFDINGSYFLDVAKHLPGENIELHLGGPGHPAMFPVQDDRWTRACVVVMPLRK